MKFYGWILVIFLLLFSKKNFSQDTLFFKDGKVLPAKVDLINEEEIKYRRWDNLEGPTYITPLWKFQFAKFANGVIDTFKAVDPTPDFLAFNPLDNKQAELFYYRGDEIYYKGRIASENVILSKAMEFRSDKKMKGLIAMRNSRKKLQRGFLTTSFIGFGITYYGALISISSNPPKWSLPVFLVGLTASISTIRLSFYYKSQRNNARFLMSKRYNELFLPD